MSASKPKSSWEAIREGYIQFIEEGWVRTEVIAEAPERSEVRITGHRAFGYDVWALVWVDLGRSEEEEDTDELRDLVGQVRHALLADQRQNGWRRLALVLGRQGAPIRIEGPKAELARLAHRLYDLNNVCSDMPHWRQCIFETALGKAGYTIVTFRGGESWPLLGCHFDQNLTKWDAFDAELRQLYSPDDEVTSIRIVIFKEGPAQCEVGKREDPLPPLELPDVSSYVRWATELIGDCPLEGVLRLELWPRVSVTSFDDASDHWLPSGEGFAAEGRASTLSWIGLSIASRIAMAAGSSPRQVSVKLVPARTPVLLVDDEPAERPPSPFPWVRWASTRIEEIRGVLAEAGRGRDRILVAVIDALLGSGVASTALDKGILAYGQTHRLRRPTSRQRDRRTGARDLYFDPKGTREAVNLVFASAGERAAAEPLLVPWLFEGFKLPPPVRSEVAAALAVAAPPVPMFAEGVAELLRFSQGGRERDREANLKLLADVLSQATKQSSWTMAFFESIFLDPSALHQKGAGAAMVNVLRPVSPEVVDEPAAQQAIERAFEAKSIRVRWLAAYFGLAAKALATRARDVALALIGNRDVPPTLLERLADPLRKMVDEPIIDAFAARLDARGGGLLAGAVDRLKKERDRRAPNFSGADVEVPLIHPVPVVDLPGPVVQLLPECPLAPKSLCVFVAPSRFAFVDVETGETESVTFRDFDVGREELRRCHFFGDRRHVVQRRHNGLALHHAERGEIAFRPDPPRPPAEGREPILLAVTSHGRHVWVADYDEAGARMVHLLDGTSLAPLDTHRVTGKVAMWPADGMDSWEEPEVVLRHESRGPEPILIYFSYSASIAYLLWLAADEDDRILVRNTDRLVDAFEVDEGVDFIAFGNDDRIVVNDDLAQLQSYDVETTELCEAAWPFEFAFVSEHDEVAFPGIDEVFLTDDTLYFERGQLSSDAEHVFGFYRRVDDGEPPAGCPPSVWLIIDYDSLKAVGVVIPELLDGVQDLDFLDGGAIVAKKADGRPILMRWEGANEPV
ncbi:MAG: hypothetical protein AAGA56_06160 [Myxococcota bacterium]